MAQLRNHLRKVMGTFCGPQNFLVSLILFQQHIYKNVVGNPRSVKMYGIFLPQFAKNLLTFLQMKFSPLYTSQSFIDTYCRVFFHNYR